MNHYDILFRISGYSSIFFATFLVSMYPDPLLIAVKCGDRKECQGLLNTGSNVNVMDTKRRTALMWSVNCAHLPVTDLLLDCGADTNKTDNKGRTALIRASSAGMVDSVALLLARDAVVDAVDMFSETALYKAIFQSQNRRIVRQLAQAGAILDYGKNPFSCWQKIVQKLKGKMVKLLLSLYPPSSFDDLHHLLPQYKCFLVEHSLAVTKALLRQHFPMDLVQETKKFLTSEEQRRVISHVASQL